MPEVLACIPCWPLCRLNISLYWAAFDVHGDTVNKASTLQWSSAELKLVQGLKGLAHSAA